MDNKIQVLSSTVSKIRDVKRAKSEYFRYVKTFPKCIVCQGQITGSCEHKPVPILSQKK